MAGDEFLEQNQQIAAKPEAVSGTPETLGAADVKLKGFRSELSFSQEIERFALDEVSEDLAQSADTPGSIIGVIGVGFQLKTGGVLGTPPAAGVYLRGCGLQQEVVNQITIGSISGGDGLLTAGSVYSATGSKTGIIEADRNGAGTLRYIVLTGGVLVASDVVTVGAESGTVSGTSTFYGVKYKPRSSGLETLTVQRASKNSAGTSAQDQLYRIKGATGTGTIGAVAGDVVKFRGDFRGPKDFVGAGSFITGYTYETGSAPRFRNAVVQINGVASVPNSWSLDIGNVIQDDPDPTTSGGVSGYGASRIERREPKLIIDPLRQKTAILDDYGLVADGSEFPISIIVGTTPNIIEIAATKGQIREHSEGTRGGRQTAGLTIYLNRSVALDEDYTIYFR